MKAVRVAPGCRRFDCLPAAAARRVGAARARPRTGRAACSRTRFSSTHSARRPTTRCDGT